VRIVMASFGKAPQVLGESGARLGTPGLHGRYILMDCGGGGGS
jgi:hypothetical protein